ncbi:9745_t:CDS:2, partial [Gigaspora margarita]
EQPPRNKGKQPKLIHGSGTNTCGECSSKGYNHSCGYKKELHNYNFIEVNDKNEWVESSDLESDDEID